MTHIAKRPIAHFGVDAYCRLFLCLLQVGISANVLAENCEPVRNCDATRDCSLGQDRRSCDPQWGCDCPIYDLSCSKVGCELDKVRYRKQCEIEKAAQNAAYSVAKGACEVQKSAEKIDCERIKTTERVACEAGLAGPWKCSAQEVMLQTRTEWQDDLTDFDQRSAFVTTPFKNATGQLSWRDTACFGNGVGIPYHNSKRSSDGYCTIDVQLISFTIDNVQKPPGNRYIRLEIQPGTQGAKLCGDRTISTRDTIKFGGPIKRDRHIGHKEWLEVHVSDDLSVLPPQVVAPSATQTSVTSTQKTVVVRTGDCLARIANSIYGIQDWKRLFASNRVRIRNPDLIYPGQVLVIPS